MQPMKADGSTLRLSATDLASHLGCRHLTQLDRAVAEGRRKAPQYFDPGLDALGARGEAHEAAYLAALRSEGRSVVEIPTDATAAEKTQRTLDAIRSGADVVYQALLTSGRWLGYADFLRRVPRASKLGSFSYEVYDTKLSKETKGTAVLQLCLYSDIIQELQGVLPESMYVVSPGSGFVVHQLRAKDYFAYYRWVRSRLEQSVDTPLNDLLPTYPEPTAKCSACRWWQVCGEKWRADDHLSLVANITRVQRRELVSRQVETVKALATLSLPLSFKPERGSIESLTGAREQARLQLEERETKALRYELLKPEPGRGLSLLHEPSPGDLFFDFEGDPFVGENGLEYLFGYCWLDGGGKQQYRGRWALSRSEERQVFEAFVDDVMRRWAEHPGMHIYHYAPYEPAALKRLMGRHGTREEQVDRMLRGGIFVDLYSVVRQSMRAGVESYSIKKLERYFEFTREAALQDVGPAKRALEAALELAPPGVPAPVELRWKETVETYNRDDCVSAMKLRNWLERLRALLVDKGHSFERPTVADPEPSDAARNHTEATRFIRERLLAGIADPAEPGSDDERGRVLLANLLDFHRREDKVAQWEYYRLRELTDDELLDEREGLAGLTFVKVVSETGLKGRKVLPIHRYSFPLQDTSIKERAELHEAHGGDERIKFGVVEAIDLAARTVDVKKTSESKDRHPTAVFVHSTPSTKELAASIARLAEWAAVNGLDVQGEHRAARDLLLRLPPRLKAGGRGLERGPAETPLDHARRLSLELDGGVLPIQGPPGTGKTYTGARMIVELVRAKKKVGVTAISHEVIKNLLNGVIAAAREEGVPLTCGKRARESDADPNSAIEDYGNNAKALEALEDGDIQVLGGTAWVWSPAEMASAVDVLFIDEAGQLALATALAVAQAARSLVLLGDPQQLQQPKKGSHPEGAEVSALEHLLGEAHTVPEDRGLFLAATHRLHPAITEFTSEVFYEDRLRSKPGLDSLRVDAGPLGGAGLWLQCLQHEGNQNESKEEVAAVATLVEQLLAPGGNATWVDDAGRRHALEPRHILIVAPYNAQVSAIEARLPNLRVGTVDRFQGQEAPIVVVSMTSSSAEDAPRGMEFLYSLNRLNVATSRAKCACVLIASPRLFEPECRTPRQIQLANALCRYREMAKLL